MEKKIQIFGWHNNLSVAKEVLETFTPKHRVMFSEIVPKGTCLSDSDGQGNTIFTMSYDDAYTFIFSLKGSISKENIEVACRIALQRVMRQRLK